MTASATTGGSDSELPGAVIDHAANPTQAYCRDCFHEALDSSDREEVPPNNVGDVLECDGCGVNIAETVERDRDG